MNELVQAWATISSIELVQMINSVRKEWQAELSHSDFLKKVPKVLGWGAGNFSSTYRDVQGKERPCYNFPKREASLMVMSESYDVQAQVYDRMDELEKKQQPKQPLALRAAELIMELSNENIVLREKIQLDAPKVKVAEEIEVSENSIPVNEFCKRLKSIDIGEKKMFALLKHSGYLNKSNLPRQEYLNDIFEVKAGTYDVKGKTKQYSQTLITGKGVTYLMQKIQEMLELDGTITILTRSNGVYSDDTRIGAENSKKFVLNFNTKEKGS